MTSGYIDDGYTLDGYIKESPRIYDAVRFKYRPLTYEQRSRLFEGWASLPAVDRTARTAAALSKQIVEWDVKDGKGAPVPANDPRSFRRLTFALHERLLDIVCGTEPPDVDPQAARPTEDHVFADEGAEGNFPAG